MKASRTDSSLGDELSDIVSMLVAMWKSSLCALWRMDNELHNLGVGFCGEWRMRSKSASLNGSAWFTRARVQIP